MGNGEPTLRVERGQASAEELAVLTVVLLALRGGQEQPEQVLGSHWWRGPDTYGAPYGAPTWNFGKKLQPER